MTDDASTPKGWPPGYSKNGGEENPFGVGWERDGLLDDEDYTTESEAMAAAHAHYRTTREYRLEQELAGLKDSVNAKYWESVRDENDRLRSQLAEVTRERDEAREDYKRCAKKYALQGNGIDPNPYDLSGRKGPGPEQR